MKTQFIQLLETRKKMLGILEQEGENAYKIPKGFKNSLYWNAAHCVVTVQLLCYKLTNNKLYVENEIVDLYKKGSVASGEKPNVLEIGIIKDLLITTIEQLEKDYNEGLFKSFTPYQTSYGVDLNTIEDSINFMCTHEALHLGYMMAMRKSL